MDYRKIITIEPGKRGGKRYQFVICIDNSNYPASLELFKVYRMLPDEDAEKDGDLRIIDESGEDYLYPADLFVIIDLPEAVTRRMIAQDAPAAS